MCCGVLKHVPGLARAWCSAPSLLLLTLPRGSVVLEAATRLGGPDIYFPCPALHTTQRAAAGAGAGPEL